MTDKKFEKYKELQKELEILHIDIQNLEMPALDGSVIMEVTSSYRREVARGHKTVDIIRKESRNIILNRIAEIEKEMGSL